MNENIDVVHQQMVKTLAKDPFEILDTLSWQKIRAWHAVTGISGEAGELLDAIKKVVVYNKPPDIANLVEELGDLEFYLEMLRRAYNIEREDTLRANMEKLAKRYPNYQYSDQRAQARADKQEVAS